MQEKWLQSLSSLLHGCAKEMEIVVGREAEELVMAFLQVVTKEYCQQIYVFQTCTSVHPAWGPNHEEYLVLCVQNLLGNLEHLNLENYSVKN